MAFILEYSSTAARHLMTLKTDSAKNRALKDVIKALRYMESNLRHPSLNTHEFHTLKGPNGEKVFESYAQQKTPGAYLIFWHYGPGKNIISILAIIPHP